MSVKFSDMDMRAIWESLESLPRPERDRVACKVEAAVEEIVKRHRGEAHRNGANSRTDDIAAAPGPKRVDGVIGA